MILKPPLKTFGSHFCQPLYSSYCFSRIPGTIRYLLTGKEEKMLPKECVGEPCDSVVLFFIDGFGWKFFEKYEDQFPFLKRIREEGIASRITSQFPSTTAPHVTCMNTGLEVGQSGIYEWFCYEPKVDDIIVPLLFSFAGDKKIESLKNAGISPEDIYPTHTFYQELEKEKIASFSFQDEDIAYSSYSKTLFQGAQIMPYQTFSQGLGSLVDLYLRQKGSKSYFYIYFGGIDAEGHRHGVSSPQFENRIIQCFDALEELFWKKVAGKRKNTAFILIADHGMTAIDPKTTIYLNSAFPEILGSIKTNRKGKLLAPAGSCRDFFLHIKEGDLAGVTVFLAQKLKGIAEVVLTQELISQGFFGEKLPSPAFLERVGNLTLLPYEKQSLWWRERGRFEQHFYGAHGGLTPEEIEIPFLFCKM